MIVASDLRPEACGLCVLVEDEHLRRLATDASTASRSHGMIVRRSTISTESPSPSSCLAASSAVWTIAPQVTTRHVVAVAVNARLAEGNRVALVGHLVLDAAVEVLVLEVENRVRILDGGREEALRVRGRSRARDLEARDVREARLRVLGVERPAGEAAAGRAAARRSARRFRPGSAAWPPPSRGDPRRRRRSRRTASRPRDASRRARPPCSRPRSRSRTSGASITRHSPNSCWKPLVTLNAPP